jgi:hypothetical protein
VALGGCGRPPGTQRSRWPARGGWASGDGSAARPASRPERLDHRVVEAAADRVPGPWPAGKRPGCGLDPWLEGISVPGGGVRDWMAMPEGGGDQAAVGMRRSISRPPGGRRHPGRRRRRPCLAEGCSVMSVTPAGPGWVRAKWRSTRSARPTRRSSSATARSGLKAEAPRLTGPGPGRRPRPGCARSVITATAGNRLGHPLSDPLRGPAQRRSSASSSAIRRLARPARLLGAGQARCQAASMRS